MRGGVVGATAAPAGQHTGPLWAWPALKNETHGTAPAAFVQKAAAGLVPWAFFCLAPAARRRNHEFVGTVCRARARHCLTAGLYFGGFQALMPLIGYLLGRQFAALITQFDHWIAFVLLAFIGANMVRESRQEECPAGDFGPRSMLPLAVATSIDALAVGITFAFLQVQIVPAVSFIGATTFLLSFVGVKVGNVFGAKYKSKAELCGGLVLIVMGLKILLEHLGILG